MVRGKPFRTNINSLIKTGVVQKPIWADIVEATRPPFEPVRATTTKKIVYPEDRLRVKYLQRNPDARRIPINLKARKMEERHIADRFVAVQLRLMQEQNMSEEKAYVSAEEIVSLRTIGEAEVLQDDLSTPLSSPSIRDEAARLYLASVRDSARDKKLHKLLQDQTSAPPSS